MRIERIRVWQWCIIGAVLGCAMAYIRLASLPKEEPGLERVAPHVFETHLLGGFDPSRKHVEAIKDIRIHPPADMPLPGLRVGQAAYCSYEVLLAETKDKGRWYPRQMMLELAVPSHPSMVGSLSGLTLQQYLDKINVALSKLDHSKRAYAKAPTSISYKYNWFETPSAAYKIYPIGGFILIGLIWPVILKALVRAGYGRAPEEDSLANYKGKIPVAAVAKKEMSEDDRDQLARLEAELESSLKSGDTPVPTAPKTTAAPAPIPVLSAGPLEAPKQEAPRARPKGFGADQGDYYPTEVHGKRPS